MNMEADLKEEMEVSVEVVAEAASAEVEVVAAAGMVATVDRAGIIDLNNLPVIAVIHPHSHILLLKVHQLTHILMKVPPVHYFQLSLFPIYHRVIEINQSINPIHL